MPPDLIDFRVIRNWLDHCYTHHTAYTAISTTANLESLRVIDCVERTIDRLPQRESYVSISYFWGLASDCHNTGELTAILPRKIQDVMAVTTILGLRYLWVDRYCIPQKDAEEKLF
ncbi:hypothetical protein DER46DRAFT_510754 [Fusarium sp. MPI-SDFR-AT-0072]|nr:hypothetical protein DER46DRAFT_510754 [Fusarium sp. MPI-SDFR-AT-0072]